MLVSDNQLAIVGFAKCPICWIAKGSNSSARVHKKLRDKRLSPVLIKSLAVYTWLVDGKQSTPPSSLRRPGDRRLVASI